MGIGNLGFGKMDSANWETEKWDSAIWDVTNKTFLRKIINVQKDKIFLGYSNLAPNILVKI